MYQRDVYAKGKDNHHYEVMGYKDGVFACWHDSTGGVKLTTKDIQCFWTPLEPKHDNEVVPQRND